MSRRRDNPYQKSDAFTIAAKARGFPARSVFKLEAIDQRVRLLKTGQHVLDLGAAPGSWSMHASQRIGPTGRLLAVDLTPIAIPAPPHVTLLQGDALDLQNEDLALYAPYDLVLSDMAPKTTGNRFADQAKSYELFCRAVDIACALGKPGGGFVGKIFMGGDFDSARQKLRDAYAEVRTLRPEAVRSSSFEIFVVGLKKKA